MVLYQNLAKVSEEDIFVVASVPFPKVLSPSGTLLTPEEIRLKFKNAGVPPEGPIVASCGTGVTACILALALHRIGKQDVAVYDGSSLVANPSFFIPHFVEIVNNS